MTTYRLTYDVLLLCAQGCYVLSFAQQDSSCSMYRLSKCDHSLRTISDRCFVRLINFTIKLKICKSGEIFVYGDKYFARFIYSK